MGFYHRRHPERSDYYRLLESGFEAFARNWPEDFESRYGFLRKEVHRARSLPLLNAGFLITVWRLCAARGVVKMNCAGINATNYFM